MTTFTMLLDDVGEAEPIAAELHERGFAEADVAIFNTTAGGENPETEGDIIARLTAWQVPEDVAAARAAFLAKGGALIAVRTTDENRDVAKAVLEGRETTPIAGGNNDAIATEADHLEADVTRASSSG
ncbi:hypothetical protein sos41_28620 [Alphaproteobacteria bacterium SO-S41]|nr:hypothetical protein sos41_28620 [Alphaproteobacteria bacterium SO-S41]